MPKSFSRSSISATGSFPQMMAKLANTLTPHDVQQIVSELTAATAGMADAAAKHWR